MVAAARVPRRRRRARDRSFIELVALLFTLGVVLLSLNLSMAKAGAPWWLWILPGVATLLGLMWLVAREPVNL